MLTIDAVDFYYAAEPEVTADADGSQDALLVRIIAGDLVAWGECEASPLTSIAAFVTPRSHGVCEPVAASVLGERLDSPADIARMHQSVRRRSMDLLQAAHVWSGVEVALWDLLGRLHQEPVWALLGYREALRKTPYASVLFGRTPAETFATAEAAIADGYTAVKFGWAGFGAGDVTTDAAHLEAARAAMGSATLMVDAGQIWADDVEAALARVPALLDAEVAWLEEPFAPDEYWLYAELAERAPSLRLAGGEAAHNPDMAKTLIRYGGVSFVQIDTGRIGGILPSHQVAGFAASHGVTYVNHTFTSHLSLSAAMQAFAGQPGSGWCEYPGALRPLARVFPTREILRDADGLVAAPSEPGIGVGVDLDRLAPYLRRVELRVDGRDLVEQLEDGGARVGTRVS
ncbi:MAG: mandelate racemase/muconate lactonizing enzyme family protein [Microbacterium sp.]